VSFVAVRDELEEQIGFLAVDRQISHFINDDENGGVVSV
jgi:hypothetical protein